MGPYFTREVFATSSVVSQEGTTRSLRGKRCKSLFDEWLALVRQTLAPAQAFRRRAWRVNSRSQKKGVEFAAVRWRKHEEVSQLFGVFGRYPEESKVISGSFGNFGVPTGTSEK